MDLTGKWQSTAPGMYYQMDPSDSTLRMHDINATFSMDITQQGNQITIYLHFKIISYEIDMAYWNEYGFGGAPPVDDGVIQFVGTVSSSSFTTVETFTSFTPHRLVGTFTTDIITATLSGDFETTDPNGIVVRRTSSSTSTSSSTTSTSDDFGTVGLVRGTAWLKKSGKETLVSSGNQVGAGSQVKTGDDSLVTFSYPDGDATVYLGENTELGWVGLESHPAPDVQVRFTVYPPDVENSFDWGEELKGLLIWTEAGAVVEMLATGAINPYLLGAEVAVHGGIILMHYGQFYIKEHGWPQLLQVPQGFVQGKNTEYAVTVTNSTTVIQVIEGQVVFLDPITNNTVTINQGMMLTLPAGKQDGFSMPTLLSSFSTFQPASLNEWWKPATTNTSLLDSFENPEMLPVIVGLVFALVVAPIGVTLSVHRARARSKKQTTQTPVNTQPTPPPSPEITKVVATKTEGQTLPQPEPQQQFAFCPECGKQLLLSKKFCPFCGFELHPKSNDNTP